MRRMGLSGEEMLPTLLESNAERRTRTASSRSMTRGGAARWQATLAELRDAGLKRDRALQCRAGADEIARLTAEIGAARERLEDIERDHGRAQVRLRALIDARSLRIRVATLRAHT